MKFADLIAGIGVEDDGQEAEMELMIGFDDATADGGDAAADGGDAAAEEFGGFGEPEEE